MTSSAAPNSTASVGSGSRAFVYLAASFAGLGGLLFGYDTGVISGAELFFKNDFTLSTFALEVIVSGVLAGAAVGALGGGRLADIFGRRLLLIATAIIFAAGARGWTVSLFQLAITIGILLAYVVDYAFAKSEAWRWMFGISLVPAAIFAIGMYFLPESPRWLVRHGDPTRARAILARIRATSNVDAELKEIEQSFAQSEQHGNWRDLLSPTLRPALIVGIGLAIFQQVTGINTVIYYAPLIIQSAGVSSASGAILATAGIGAVNVLMTIVSMWLIDRIGRRPLLLTGIAGMVVTLGVLGWAFHSNVRSEALSWLAVTSMMVYVASFAISLGPIFWLLIAEIYPLQVRSSSEGLAATFNWGSNLLVSLTFLTLLQGIGAPKTFWLYGLCAIGAWIFSYSLVPETKGRTLEQIEQFWRK